MTKHTKGLATACIFLFIRIWKIERNVFLNATVKVKNLSKSELQIKIPGGKSTIHTIQTVRGAYRRITIYALIAAHWVKKYVQISLQMFSEDKIIQLIDENVM